MYEITLKNFRRWFDGDTSYSIRIVYCTDSQLGYWLAHRRTKDYEIISYRHC